MTGSAVLLAEFVSGVLLALIVSFFLLKDFDKICDAALDAAPPRRRESVRLLGRRAWSTLGAYLRGVAVLGTVEALIISVAVWLVGGELVAAVAAVTLLGAFVPIVGAIVAGAVAVLVTLATAGFAPAAIVLVVAIVVQQLDNDLLAPVIYGRSFQLHPLVILLSVAVGTALFGIVGAVFAVPTTAIALNLAAEWRDLESDAPDGAIEG
jgi:predicted PurR-regulated permease PerM